MRGRLSAYRLLEGEMVVGSLNTFMLRILFGCAVLLGAVGSTHAVEGGKNGYLLGLGGAQAGILPPPGVYFQGHKYYYQGDAAPELNLERGGRLLANVDVEILFEVPVLKWVTNQKILGGTLAFGALMPIGWQEAKASAELSLANFGITLNKNLKDDLFSYGDLFFLTILGWNAGDLHWNIAGMLGAPVGDYKRGRIVNMGLNRWVYDVTGSLTWLNKKTGREISISPGFTFNGENDDTNYDSGDEFHVEFLAAQHFPNGLSLGVAGYHYNQISGDSGSGAVLGSFKGRTTAVGPFVGYNFKWRGLPISAQGRWLREFDTEKRLEGDVGVFTLTIPLGGSGPPPAK